MSKLSDWNQLPEESLPSLPSKPQSPPDLTADDKLAFRTMEVEALKAAMQANQVIELARGIQTSLNKLSDDLLAKLGLSKEEWYLDPRTLKPIARDTSKV